LARRDARRNGRETVETVGEPFCAHAFMRVQVILILEVAGTARKWETVGEGFFDANCLPNAADGVGLMQVMDSGRDKGAGEGRFWVAGKWWFIKLPFGLVLLGSGIPFLISM